MRFGSEECVWHGPSVLTTSWETSTCLARGKPSMSGCVPSFHPLVWDMMSEVGPCPLWALNRSLLIDCTNAEVWRCAPFYSLLLEEHPLYTWWRREGIEEVHFHLHP